MITQRNSMNQKIRHSLIVFGFFLLLFVVTGSFKKQDKKDPWSQSQLMEPGDLAKILENKKMAKTYIFSIGPGAVIKGSIEIGPVQDGNNMLKFKKQLAVLPKDANIVIYCGCCPFEHCPNIRPGFAILTAMKFTNAMLLNLQHNVKVDWIDKGYPKI